MTVARTCCGSASDASRIEGDHSNDGTDWRRMVVFAALTGAFGFAGYMIELFAPELTWASRLLFSIAYLTGGWDAARGAFRNLIGGHLEIDFLMIAVAVGAASIGAWGEGVLLLFLFSSAGAMETFAMYRTRREINSLLKLAPKEAIRIDSETGNEQPIQVDDICAGEWLRIPPGTIFPVDGMVLEGDSAADESTLTGESTPIAKAKGSDVLSGTLNLWGSVTVQATSAARESSLQKVIDLIADAQQRRAPSQRFTDRFGTRYTMLVLGTVTVMFFVWWLLLDRPAFEQVEGNSAFYRSMTLLVVASPCALVLSIPSAILAAIAWGARHGVLFRGGAAIERLAEVNVLAFDKTGTLSMGDLCVDRIETFPSGNEARVAHIAYSIERKASHPIARALVRYGRDNGFDPLPVMALRSHAGSGVEGEIDGSVFFLGSRESLPKSMSDAIQEAPTSPLGYSEVWLAGNGLIGRFLLRDQPRRESKAVISALVKRGIAPKMLTGDRPESAHALATAIGLPPDSVRAGLKPEGKVSVIRKLSDEGNCVAMVGDGINDAPSLATADVAIAMGVHGSDAALEQADLVLMNDRLENLLSAMELSGRARSVIRQNLIVSLGAVVLMSSAALLGLVPLSLGVLAHEGSTVVVCLNSLRLLFLKPSDFAPQTSDK